jgi:hypothetical protein
LPGRVAGGFLAGEDLEVLSHIQKGGWEIWYNPRMEINHKIPRDRLTREYLTSLMAGIGLSRYVTRTVGLTYFQKPWVVLAYWLNDLRKLLIHMCKYPKTSGIVTAAERELLVKSLLSPLYFWLKHPLNN